MAETQTMQTMETTDPKWTGNGELSAIDRFFLPKLRDERDLIFARNSVRIMLFVCLPGLLMYLAPTWLTWCFAVPYIAWVFTQFTGRYSLMLHATAHRVLFKREHDRWNKMIPWFLGPFFGHTPTSFFIHHIGMHHPENNLEPDLSSTMGYRRDNFLHFLHYWARFNLTGYLHMTRYFLTRRRKKVLRNFVAGELSWLVAISLLLYVDWAATLVVFVIPLVLIRFFLMAGNFAQHSFVDQADPANPYRNSTCLINTRYNHKCYNDGYHIVHHIEPSLHWTEMAKWFEDRAEEFGRQDAVVFSAIGDNQAVFWALMTGNYDKLAKHMVQLPGAPERTHDEKVAFLKERVQHPDAKGIKGLLEVRESPWGAPPLKAGASA